MQMEYFTPNGVRQVQKTFGYLIDKVVHFYDSENLQKLIEIKGEYLPEKGYIIKFHSDHGLFMPIYKFMPRNNLMYNFDDFERQTIEV